VKQGLVNDKKIAHTGDTTRVSCSKCEIVVNKQYAVRFFQADTRSFLSCSEFHRTEHTRGWFRWKTQSRYLLQQSCSELEM